MPRMFGGHGANRSGYVIMVVLGGSMLISLLFASRVLIRQNIKPADLDDIPVTRLNVESGAFSDQQRVFSSALNTKDSDAGSRDEGGDSSTASNDKDSDESNSGGDLAQKFSSVLKDTKKGKNVYSSTLNSKLVEEEELPTIFYDDKLPDGRVISREVIHEPIPDDCYPHKNADYDGPAVMWGMTHKTPSAAKCCQACKDFKPNPHPCNVWVWCGDPSGRCWSPDIWNHTTGECWLKYQPDWDNNPDLSATNLKINHAGQFAEAYRNEHKTAPLMVPWMAGVVVLPESMLSENA